MGGLGCWLIGIEIEVVGAETMVAMCAAALVLDEKIPNSG